MSRSVPTISAPVPGLGRLRVTIGVLVVAATAGYAAMDGARVWTFLACLYLGSTLLHEVGHVLAAWVAGGRVTCLSLTMMGGRTEWEGAPSRATFVAVALAGPTTSLCVAAAASLFAGPAPDLVVAINVMVAVANLVPLPGSDGAMVVAALRDRPQTRPGSLNP